MCNPQMVQQQANKKKPPVRSFMGAIGPQGDPAKMVSSASYGKPKLGT